MSTQGPVSSPPVFQSSSLPVFQIQFHLESESGDPYWSPILENPFLEGCSPHPPEEFPAPKFGYLASSWRSCAPSWLILALLGLILSPSCSKMARSWRYIAQHRAKMNQHGLQKHAQDSQEPLSALLSLFLGFSSVLARWRPRSQKSHQDASTKTLSCVS